MNVVIVPNDLLKIVEKTQLLKFPKDLFSNFERLKITAELIPMANEVVKSSVVVADAVAVAVVECKFFSNFLVLCNLLCRRSMHLTEINSHIEFTSKNVSPVMKHF